MSKEVDAGGRFDIFLGSGSKAQLALMNYQLTFET